VGWLEGALRLGFPIEVVILGIRIPEPFIPGVLIPGALFAFMAVWPFLERFFTHDNASHNLLDYPWEAPKRTAIGAAVLTFFVVLTIAGGNDVIAFYLNVPVATITTALQVGQVLIPVAVGLIVYLLAVGKRRRMRTGVPDEAGRDGEPLERTESGAFVEDHEATA
jgi:ubiquinol-cytochrome c reductase cytochrome b subunit